MRNEEFDIVRDLIAGRGQRWSPSPYTSRSIEPASFREIDGQELARQYVAHRKFRELERLAQETGRPDAVTDRIRLGSPVDERRADAAIELSAYQDQQSGSWLSSLARLLRLR